MNCKDLGAFLVCDIITVLLRILSHHLPQCRISGDTVPYFEAVIADIEGQATRTNCKKAKFSGGENMASP